MKAFSRFRGIPNTRTFLFLILSLTFIQFGFAQPSGFSDQLYMGNWNQVVGFVYDDNGRMFVWEKAGKVWIVENGIKASSPILDISEEVGGWRDFGLVGFVLDPNFLSNGHMYLQYTVDRHHLMNFGTSNYNPNTNEYFAATIGRVTRYTAQAATNFSTVNYNSRKILIGETKETGVPSLHESHGIGALLFGEDGTLMVSTGDGASYSSVDQGSASETYYQQALSDGIIPANQNVGAYRSQMLSSLDGKLLRIDPETGDGLPSNPFYQSGNPRSAQSRVWASGLRNPYRMAKKPGTGSHYAADGDPGVFYIGDVGWGSREELNVVDAPGLNFGWPKFEGMTHQPGYNNAAYAPANHERPIADWRTGSARGIKNGNIYNIGSSQIPGSSFNGNASTGGVFYTGDDFPTEYKNTYFHADYGADWIKNFITDENHNLLEVKSFKDAGGPIVYVGTHPIEGGIYYVKYPNEIRKISYTQNNNKPPLAIASSDIEYGAGPLQVNFTGDRSFDPEFQSLTYNWNFGDGNTSTDANPTHTFSHSNNNPRGFNVSLTVTDPAGNSDQTALVISINNTPPVINSTSIDNINDFDPTTFSTINLNANISDAEHSNNVLDYSWVLSLRHDDHFHEEPEDINPSTSAQLSPLSCSDATYWYRIELTVTDPGGLSAFYKKDIYPDCPGTNQNISFAVIPDKLISDNPFAVTPTASSGLPVQVVISDGPAYMNAGNITLTGVPGTVNVLALQPGNNVYAPAIPVSRSFTVGTLQPANCTATGAISYEQWNNISGTAIADIPLSIAPSQSGEANLFEMPTNVADNYGVRMRGYVCPPFTGNYKFWISSDDNGALYLSTDNNEANKNLIASVPGWTNSREWNKFPEQQSVDIYLVAGNKYYIEALMKEQGGGDNLAVGWQLPNGTLERPIGGGALSLWDGGITPTVLKAEADVEENVGSAWKTITLNKNYDNMVVSATPVITNTADKPAVVRIRNANGNSFQMKVQNPSDESLSGYRVHYFVVEEGVYSQADHGIKMEAYTFTSTITAGRSDWSRESQSPSNSYTNPVVLGQVMTANDPDWSVFWASSGNAISNPPTSNDITAGKNVAEDTDVNRSNETIGVVILEAGNGTMDGLEFYANLGPDITGGVEGSGGYDNPISGLTQPGTTVAAMATMEGNNGGWAVLYGSNPVAATTVKLAVEEDQIRDSERAHISERLGYIVFNDGVINPGPQDQTITFGSLADKLTTDPAFSLNATASSGLTVSFSIVSGPATISGNTVTLTGAEGTVTIAANQSGDVNYNPAPSISRSFQVTAPNTGPTDYCESSSAQPWVEWIKNVNIGNLNHDSHKCDGNCGYSDFTFVSATLAQSSDYTLTITPGLSWSGYQPDLFFRAWIDYNADGDFTDAGEKVLEANNGNQLASELINIPGNAIIGDTRMRVSMQRGAYANPCENFIYGEVEDYTISIISGGNNGSISLSCPTDISLTTAVGENTIQANWNTPSASTTCPANGLILNQTAGAVSGSQFGIGTTTIGYQATDDCGNVKNCSFTITVISGGGACSDVTDAGTIGGAETYCGTSFNPGIITSTQGASGGSGALEYRWQRSTNSANGAWTELSHTGATYDPNTISQTTWYRRQAKREDCTDWSASSNVIVKVVDPNCSGPTEYCDAIGAEPWWQWISNVTFNTIDNTTGKDGYGDYTTINTTLDQGATYPISIQNTFSYTQWDEHIIVWIDFNQDGDFIDAGEQVFSQISPEGTPHVQPAPVTGTIAIPASAMLGSTRMRIAMQQEMDPLPCGNFQYGEVEDYTVNIAAPVGGQIQSRLVLEGQRHPNGVKLDWLTNEEIKNEYFIIERALDGNHFNELFQVDSDFNTAGIFQYQQIDEDPYPGRNFYRIKEVMEDGSFRFSEVVTIYYSPREREVLLFPNPAQDILRVSIPFYAGLPARIMIVNNLGQVVHRSDIASISLTPLTIELDDFKNGLYSVSVKVEGKQRMTGQLVVKKGY